MAELTLSDERTILAPAEMVYRVIADYATHHAGILPSEYSDYAVESGGFGADTVITYDLTLSGRTTSHRATISEPEPGRVLVESEERMRAVTTYTVMQDGENETRVRISTTMPRSPGLRGWGEKVFAGRVLIKLYRGQLHELDQYVKSLRAADPTSPEADPTE